MHTDSRPALSTALDFNFLQRTDTFMAESVGVASGVLVFMTFTFQLSIKFYELVKSFQSHQQRVRDLLTFQAWEPGGT